MKYFVFLIFDLINRLFCSYLNGILSSKYPFSKKIFDNQVAIFLNYNITIYKVPPNIKDYKIPEETTDEKCFSYEENGGIYFNGHYYTSCLKEEEESNENEFIIKYCNYNISECKTIRHVKFKCAKGKSIKFFQISSSFDLVGVAWGDNSDYFHLFNIRGDTIIGDGFHVQKSGLNDLDCIYIKGLDRTICAYGQYIVTEGKYEFSLNTFESISYKDDEKDGNDMINNLKSHSTRKMRVYPRSSQEPENSAIFYYYYISTNNDAYIKRLRLKSKKQNLRIVVILK